MAARRLQCYAEGVGEAWQAVCPDLEIEVEGRSFDEVLGALREAIALHLGAVWGLGPEERRRLLGQSAPWRCRLRHAWNALRARLGAGEPGPEQHRFSMMLAV